MTTDNVTANENGIALFEPHEYALMLPPMKPEEREELKADIRDNKQQEPIKLFEGKVLDGRNRMQAIQELNGDGHDIVPWVEDFVGDKAAALRYVISKNIKRRNITSSQRAASVIRLGDEMERLKAIGEGYIAKGNDGEPHNSTEIIAQMVGSNRDYVNKAKKIYDEAPDVLDCVSDGLLSIDDAKSISQIDQDKRTPILTQLKEADDPKAELKKLKRKAVFPGKQGKAAGGTDEHYTPEVIMNVICDVLGEIDFDPFSCDVANKVVQAKAYLTIEDNALLQPWQGKKLFTNPPYGDNKKACEKWVDYFKIGSGEEGIMLNKLDPRTSWFELMFIHCDALAIHRGSVAFGDAKNIAPFPVVYFYFGVNIDKFISKMSAIAYAYPSHLDEYVRGKMPKPGITGGTVQSAQTQRINRYDKVCIVPSLKQEVRDKNNYPSSKEAGTVMKVSAQTAEVQWETHDPTIQRVKKAWLMQRN